MELEEIEKEIEKELRAGERFYYIKYGNKIIVGVRMGYDLKHDEFEIYYCEDYNMVTSGLINKNDAFSEDTEEWFLCKKCGLDVHGKDGTCLCKKENQKLIKNKFLISEEKTEVKDE